MDCSNAIEIKDLTIRFNLASESIDSIKEYIIKIIKKQLLFKEFFAIKGLSLNVKQGEAVGIVGTNGSGKSTLLKVISGIYKPYQGTVEVNGRIAPLIELGAGFDGELTARENVFLNGALFGLNRKFMEEQFDEIMNFAELWDFVDVPLKNFSSGMTARLGFSIATLVKPDILICDEILSVGDVKFQEKCESRIQELMKDGTTLLFVSHSSDQIKKVCNRAIMLEHGSLIADGNVEEICEYYYKRIYEG